MKTRVRQKFLLFSFMMLGGVGLIGYVVFKSHEKLLDAEKWVQHTEQVIYQSGNISSLGKDLEIASLDFIITNDSALLKSAMVPKTIFAGIARLKQLTHDRPSQQQRVDSLHLYMQQYLDYSFQIIEKRRSMQLSTFDIYAFSKQAMQYSSQVHRMIDSIQKEEGTLLKQRSETNQQRLQTFKIFSLAMFILIAVSTIFLLINMKNYLIQNKEKESRAAELLIANRELALQNEEKEKKAAALIIANNELAFQNQEKEKRAAELIIANKELAFQNNEKGNRAGELFIANKELALQNEEKEKRAAELVIANIELAFQNEEKEKRAAELLLINKELNKTDAYLKEYILGLEEMMFMTSHKVRHPVANILGLSNLLKQSLDSPDKLKQIVNYMKESAISLDTFTRELTTFMSELEQKGKNKKPS